MSYPSLFIDFTSAQRPRTDLQIQRATNGKARGRVFYTTPKSSFSLTHSLVSAANFATYKAFWLSSLTSSFPFVWPGDGVTYTCIFAGDPVFTPTPGNKFTISVEIQEV